MHSKRAITLLLFISAFSCAYAQKTVIKAGHVFHAKAGKMLSNQIIIINDGKVEKIGTNISYSPTDSVIDLSSSYVLPGLIDCHVHITSNLKHREPSLGDQYTNESSAFRALQGAFVARQLIEGGFTTIKDIGNDANYATADVIKAIQRGWFKGPTIVYSGKIIAPYGGQTRGINPENEFFWQLEYLDADTPDEIKKAIRKNIYHGANTIKLVSGDNAYYDLEDIQAAVKEAAKTGVKVTVHVMGGQAARNVIMGGAAAIEHGFELDDELLKLMKDKGTFLVGTDFSLDNFLAYGIDSAGARQYSSMIVDRLKRAYAVGTKMAFGSDIIIDLPGKNRFQTNMKVLESWKSAQIPPAYILQTMTIFAAELLGMQNKRGAIGNGLHADIIAVKKDPSKDIDALLDVHFVMKNGEVIKKN